MDSLCKVVKSVGGLVLSLTVTGIVLMFGGAGQSCTLSLPAIAFRNAFDDMDVNPCVMSRTLECTEPCLAPSCPGTPLPSCIRVCSACPSPSIALQPDRALSPILCGRHGIYRLWRVQEQ